MSLTMRILVFTDPHGNMNLLRKHREQSKKVDVVLVTGDISFMGRDLEQMFLMLETFYAPVFVIHGNHDDEEEMQHICSQLKNVTFMHKSIAKVGDWWIGGFSTSGLREHYPEQEAWVAHNYETIKQAKPLLWLDHPPPARTTLDELAEDWHVGSESLRLFIEEFKPRYVFCGHIHETFGQEDMIDETIIINSGPTGKIIELE